jgi:hypothetical protein
MAATTTPATTGPRIIQHALEQALGVSVGVIRAADEASPATWLGLSTAWADRAVTVSLPLCKAAACTRLGGDGWSLIVTGEASFEGALNVVEAARGRPLVRSFGCSRCGCI